MKSAYLYKSSLIIKIALATAILLIVYITSVFFDQMQNLGRSVDSMQVSNRKMVELERVMEIIGTNESAVRSFIITGDSTYLQNRFIPKRKLIKHYDELAKLRQESDIFEPDSLRSMVDRRFDQFNFILYKARLHRPGDPILSTAIARTDKLTDSIRDYISASMRREVERVDLNHIDHSFKLQRSTLTSFVLVTIALFILLISLNRINSDLNNLKKLNEELKLLNYTFNSAERIAGISHWKYNLELREYTFSENFYHMMMLDPEEYKPSLDNILPFIHHDDREAVLNAFTDSLVNRTPVSVSFKIFPSPKEMRYIKTVGSFVENGEGEALMIGVNYDITEQSLRNAELEQKNRSLMATNAELESFNNIVSHDLQEPLRKIQMFISRLEDRELQAMSEQGREYFSRIGSSANRMQTLLIDLVNYSRAMKGDRVFEKADLNAILNDVIAGLSTDIEESGAVITVGNLPVLRAIPFQIHQLFLNLISNSIKFQKPGVAPHISIDFEKTDEPEVREDIIIPPKRFARITVTDNGIGFRQEFADKIFLLFRRLQKESYEGTGIGLAICKRVVENHNGYIFAESKPGGGARFTIYLPFRH